ncbi:MAG: autotransporter-associated beta strand repeat-containing protein, partial [Verrucomicrobiae bacterium]|nr:autotransporter-associated beta strand repeat-containing protein [Verrucomicrobiae bacterium]
LGNNFGTNTDGRMWGNPTGGGNTAAGVEYEHPTTLNAGEVITMNANINRGSGYSYGMRVFLWDGADAGTRVEKAGGTQAPAAVGALTQVSYTVTPADITAGLDHVVFRYSHDGNWGETNDVSFAVNPAPSGFTWTNTSGGSWATSGDWTPAGPADGADNAGLINSLDITGDQTITLDGTYTIGSLWFADTVGADGNWILNTGTGGPLTLSAPVEGDPGVEVANQTATVNAVLTGTEGLTKTGGGTLVLGAANTYTGGTFIEDGTVEIADTGAIPSGAGAGNVTLDGTLDLADTSITLNGLSGSGTVTNSGTGTPTLTIGGDDASSSFGGIFDDGTGTTSVVKTGTGTLNLTGSNVDVGGGIDVTGGRLRLNRNAAGGINLGSTNIDLGPTRELVVAIGTGISGGSVTMGTGSLLGIQNGNPLSGGAGFAPNIVLNAGSGATDAASIGGFIYGNNTNLTGTISGTGDLRWRNNILGGGTNSATLTAANNTSGWAVNSYTGATSFEGVSLTFSLASNANNDVINPFGGSANAVTQTGGTLRFLTTGGGAGNTSIIENDIDFNVADGGTAVFYREDGNLRLSGGVDIATAGSGKVVLSSRWGNATTKGFELTGVLSGSGNLTVSRNSGEQGTVHLVNDANTYNGLLTVDNSRGEAGILVLDADGAAANAALNLASSGAHLNVNTSNATVASLAGVAGSQISARTAGQTLTVNQTGDTTFAGVLGGTGITGADVGLNLVKSGAGILTLTGVNLHTGTTTVTGGTLAVNGSSLADGASLTLDGGKVDLTGTETVDSLFFGAAQQAAGTWGSSSSVPTPTNIDDSRFSGTGVLSVTNGAAGGYTSWAATNAPGQTADQDFDGDGVENGIEWVLGGDKDTNDLGKVPTITPDPTSLIFSFVRDQASKTAGTTVEIAIGTTLGTWPDVYPVPNSGTLGPVTVVDNGNGTDTVTLTVTKAPDTAKFARLEVVVD